MMSGRLQPALLFLAGTLFCQGSAQAGCSRPIHVPAAAAGYSVTVKDAQVGGMFPEMLNLIGARAGCTFTYSVVPRVRIETMFANGQADMLLAATEVERRGQHGVFIPMFETRPSLVMLSASARGPVRSLAALLARRDLRVVLVRGYDYGATYRSAIATLEAQGRVYFQPDPQTVARMLASSMADVTIMPAGVFLAGTVEDSRTEDLAKRVRVEQLPELPWVRSGVYLSRTTLSAADRNVIEQAITGAVKSGLWWQAMKRYYPGDVLAGSTRSIRRAR